MSFVLSLTQMLVLLYVYVMLSILLSILVCAAASLFCACLVSVQVSAPYVIAGSTQELYTCLFRQMARLEVTLVKLYTCLYNDIVTICNTLFKIVQTVPPYFTKTHHIVRYKHNTRTASSVVLHYSSKRMLVSHL